MRATARSCLVRYCARNSGVSHASSMSKKLGAAGAGAESVIRMVTASGISKKIAFRKQIVIHFGYAPSIDSDETTSPSGGGSKGRNLALPFFSESEREDLLIHVHFLTENSHRPATG